MTLDESLAQVQLLWRDHKQGRIDDSVLKAWLEQGQQDTASLTYCYQRLATYTQADVTQILDAEQRVYDVEDDLVLTDLLWILHATWNRVPLLRWAPPQVGVTDVRSEGQGLPRFYQSFADAFILLPIPSVAELRTYRLQLTYAALPGTWTSGAGVLPIGADMGPVWFTLSRVAIEKRLWTQAAQWYQAYLSLIQRTRLQQLLQTAQDMSADVMPVRDERQDTPRRPQLLRAARQVRGR